MEKGKLALKMTSSPLNKPLINARLPWLNCDFFKFAIVDFLPLYHQTKGNKSPLNIS